MTRPRTLSVNVLIMLFTGRTSAPSYGRVRLRAFRERSPSTGIVLKAGFGPERREIMVRRNGLAEGPQIAHAVPDREIGWPGSGAPDAPASQRPERWRSRRQRARTLRRLRFLRPDKPAHHRPAAAPPRGSVGCICVTTRAPRAWRSAPRGTRRACREPGREEA